MALSPTTAYYIRRLMRQNLDQLQPVVAKGAGMQADLFNDLNAVIQSLYLDAKEIKSTLFELERLVNFHKGLSSQTGAHQKELGDIEKRLFWLLGFKLKTADHQGKILLIDDMPENLRLLTKALSHQGYDVSCAISGPMALNAIRKISPDLILLDIRMPGMDGYAVCHQLKSTLTTQNIPVLFVSASDDVADKVKAFEMGGADYVTKPFQIEEVLARIHHQLRIRELQRRLEDQNMNLQKQISNHPSDKPMVTAESPVDLQVMINKLPIVIHRYCLDETWKTLYVSDALQMIVGFDSSVLIQQGRPWTQLIHPVDRQAVEQKIHAAIEQKMPYALEFRVVHADSSVRWVYQQGQAELSADGSVKYIDSTLVDISACKQSLVSI